MMAIENRIMKIIAEIAIFLSILLTFLAADPSAPRGTSIVRPDSSWAEWTNESNLIAQFHKTSNGLPEETKVSLLFICVKLHLSDSVAEKGARLFEIAFVYSEVKNEDGSPDKKIIVLFREPYFAREWDSGILEVVEGEGTLGGVLALEGAADDHRKILQYAKRVISPLDQFEHVISIIAFEGAIKNSLGKNITDEEFVEMAKPKKLELPTQNK